MTIQTFFGFLFSILGSLCTSLGLYLQTIDMKSVNQVPFDLYSIYGRQVVFLGIILKLFTDGLLTQCTCSILSAQTIIYSNLIGYFFLKNELNTITRNSIVIIIVGTFVALMGSNNVDKVYAERDIMKLFFSLDAFLATIISLGIITLLQFVLNTRSHSIEYQLIYSCLVTGLFAGLFNTFVKGLVEITFYIVFHSVSDILTIGYWFIFFVSVVIGIVKFKVVSDCVATFHRLLFIPFYQCCAIFINALFSILFFDEFKEKSWSSLAIYLVGTLIVCAGIAMLALKFDREVDAIAIDTELGAEFAAKFPMTSTYQSYDSIAGNNTVKGSKTPDSKFIPKGSLYSRNVDEKRSDILNAEVDSVSGMNFWESSSELLETISNKFIGSNNSRTGSLNIPYIQIDGKEDDVTSAIKANSML